MKAAFALGALAALCQSAFSLSEGSYTIGSAALDPSLVLSETTANDGLLEFTQKEDDHPGQTWLLSRSGSSDRDFLVENILGGYLHCGDKPDYPCFTAEDPRIYTLEFAGENKYQFVAQGSGYFLRVNEKRELVLAVWDQSLNEQLSLTSTA
ncbi:uncharacterized protein N7496_012031 [Penicillium cataractarum]|uniref:Uncharacterized protein n=1 Tax=Penicillium cataractarum TaxID=2100454 RepID=A0A9W9UW15_9EURO|nr:uncharacterized protein N7496_012031 [Penicillium cataractarum]KAJ5359618.1 hypothetical protein N7496_012031 [Penicillium cataractarum]